MSQATPSMRRFARCLIACETKGNKSSGAKAAASFPVPEKLRVPLTVLMGRGGFRALLSRALALATAEVRWLRTVQAQAAILAAAEPEAWQQEPDEGAHEQEDRVGQGRQHHGQSDEQDRYADRGP